MAFQIDTDKLCEGLNREECEHLILRFTSSMKEEDTIGVNEESSKYSTQYNLLSSLNYIILTFISSIAFLVAIYLRYPIEDFLYRLNLSQNMFIILNIIIWFIIIFGCLFLVSLVNKKLKKVIKEAQTKGIELQ